MCRKALRWLIPPMHSQAGLLFLAITFALPMSAEEADVSCHMQWSIMRDGVRLATEVYLPVERRGSTTSQYPVIMQRSPYNNSLAVSNCDSALLKALAAHGYAVLNQDVRGTARSEGELSPIHQEASDGYDAVEWAARQSWSNGKVGLDGASYLGMTALQGASAAPPHLVAVHAHITGSDYHDNWTYDNSVFALGFTQSWLHLSLARDTYRRHLKASGLAASEAREKAKQWYQNSASDLLSTWLQQMPLDTFKEFRDIAPYYYLWLEHQDYDAFWSAVDLERQYFNIKVPVLNTGGWYDIFAVGTVRNFEGIRRQGGTPLARKQSRLVMLPICHNAYCGPISYSEEPFQLMGDQELRLRWWDYWLKGIDNGIEDEPAVRLFVMEPPDSGTKGSGFWLQSDSLPLPGMETKRFYLSSGGRANFREGDGVLDSDGPSQSPSDKFVYDPNNPVPTLGGNLCCFMFPGSESVTPGAYDQSQLELRKDILVYTSKPLQEDLIVVGSARFTFWASSSARDTDFTAKLVDVHHDGFAQNIMDRIVRARYRKGSKQPPALIEPGKAYQYELELGTTAIVFKKGHRIRLEVSSSNFPKYERNTNTGNTIASDTEIKTAKQVIFHDRQRPSFLSLPVLPAQQAEQLRIP